MAQDFIGKAVVTVMALAITALFLAMIAPFLMALLLAALFTVLVRPLYLRLVPVLGGRRALASFLTLLATAVVVVLPLAFLATLLVAQAVDVSAAVSGWVKATVEEPGEVGRLLQRLPFYETLKPYQGEILQQAGDSIGAVSRLIVEGLSSVTLGTANLVLLMFVMLYSMFYLQLDGKQLMERVLYYVPLRTRDERILLDKLASVTRATLRGSLLIGLLQGSLAGFAFWVAGIPNSVFWGAVMAVLSVIPALGSGIVWIPAVIILIAQGQVWTGIGLTLFCALVVGTLDNLLRPILVGKDTKMSELMIFLSTLGGIFMFGFPGVLVGPLIASLFISIWELYGYELRDVLPHVGPQPLVGIGENGDALPLEGGLPAEAMEPEPEPEPEPARGEPATGSDSALDADAQAAPDDSPPEDASRRRE